MYSDDFCKGFDRKRIVFLTPHSSALIRTTEFYKGSGMTRKNLHDFALGLSPDILILRRKIWKMALHGLVWPPGEQSVVTNHRFLLNSLTWV